MEVCMGELLSVREIRSSQIITSLLLQHRPLVEKLSVSGSDFTAISLPVLNENK